MTWHRPIPNGDAETEQSVSQLEPGWAPVTTLERQTPTRQVRNYVPRPQPCAHAGLPFRRAGEGA